MCRTDAPSWTVRLTELRSKWGHVMGREEEESGGISTIGTGFWG